MQPYRIVFRKKKIPKAILLDKSRNWIQQTKTKLEVLWNEIGWWLTGKFIIRYPNANEEFRKK